MISISVCTIFSSSAHWGYLPRIYSTSALLCSGIICGVLEQPPSQLQVDPNWCKLVNIVLFL